VAGGVTVTLADVLLGLIVVLGDHEYVLPPSEAASETAKATLLGEPVLHMLAV